MRPTRCPRCGAPVGDAGGRGAAGGRTGGRVAAALGAWLAVLMLVAWLGLRLLDYGGRAAVYRSLSTAGESFLHPGWGAALAVLAALLFLMARRRAGETRRAPAVLAPDVHLRAEPPGKLTVSVTGTRDALARDFVVARSYAAERALVASFEGLARRAVAFEGAGANGRPSADEVSEVQRELHALGLEIGRTILGGTGEAADALVDLHGDHLQLSIPRELSHIPWELTVARPGGSFLWQLFSVSRQLRDEVGASASRRPRRGPLRVLLLADLECDTPGRALPAADREAIELMDLAAGRPEVLRVTRKTPANGGELTRLLREGYDILHFAGHTVDDPDAGGSWVLAGGETVDPAAAAASSMSPPLLVFANACSSGPDARDAGTADAAVCWMRAGTQAYLCTLWKLHDAGSAAFSTAFYRALVGGATLGDAVTRARSALVGVRPITWANYALYGDPLLRLTRASQYE